MKVIAYVPSHYGIEYLEASIKSIDDHVDKIVILYTEFPSYGHASKFSCPEKESDLRDLAFASSNKIEWVRLNYTDGNGRKIITVHNEGQHRDYAFRFTDGYDVMLTLDTDEIWEPSVLEETIKTASETDARYIGIDGFVGFWRDFDHVVIDWFHPVRIHNLRSQNRAQKDIKSTIYHMGYAQSREIMDYKFQVHGHKSEIKSNYLEKKFYPWHSIGCGIEWLHPASTTIWQDAEKYDKNQLPELLKQHPNFNKKLI